MLGPICDINIQTSSFKFDNQTTLNFIMKFQNENLPCFQCRCNFTQGHVLPKDLKHKWSTPVLCDSLIFQKITGFKYFKLIKIKEPANVIRKERKVILRWKSLTFWMQVQQDLLEISKEQKEGYNKYCF